MTDPGPRTQLDPDMMANGLSGLPCLAFNCMKRNTFLLDPTRPRVKAWWDTLFRCYAGYGYRYFKLDFLSAANLRNFWSEEDLKASGGVFSVVLEPHSCLFVEAKS